LKNLKYMYFAIVAGAALSFASCGDPVHDDDVASLGPEDPKVLPGPLHRPGQPCLVCHGGRGPAKASFSMAGTIYQALQDANGNPSRLPLEGAVVALTDATAKKHSETTNAAGNFLVHADDFTPSYPVHVQISFNGTSASMSTHIGRDGSCAGCHHDPEGTQSPGHIYLVLSEGDLPMSQ
jgi:hypothetical protein